MAVASYKSPGRHGKGPRLAKCLEALKYVRKKAPYVDNGILLSNVNPEYDGREPLWDLDAVDQEIMRAKKLKLYISE